MLLDAGGESGAKVGVDFGGGGGGGGCGTELRYWMVCGGDLMAGGGGNVCLGRGLNVLRGGAD